MTNEEGNQDEDSFEEVAENKQIDKKVEIPSKKRKSSAVVKEANTDNLLDFTSKTEPNLLHTDDLLKPTNDDDLLSFGRVKDDFEALYAPKTNVKTFDMKTAYSQPNYGANPVYPVYQQKPAISFADLAPKDGKKTFTQTTPTHNNFNVSKQKEDPFKKLLELRQ